jgi:hypothetical protein
MADRDPKVTSGTSEKEQHEEDAHYGFSEYSDYDENPRECLNCF